MSIICYRNLIIYPSKTFKKKVACYVVQYLKWLLELPPNFLAINVGKSAFQAKGSMRVRHRYRSRVWGKVAQ